MAVIDDRVAAFKQEANALFTRSFFQRKFGFGNDSLSKHRNFIKNYLTSANITVIQSPQYLFFETMQGVGITDLDEKNLAVWNALKEYLTMIGSDRSQNNNNYDAWMKVLNTIDENTKFGFESELDPKVSNALNIVRNVIDPEIQSYEMSHFFQSAKAVFDEIMIAISSCCGWIRNLMTTQRPAESDNQARNYGVTHSRLRTVQNGNGHEGTNPDSIGFLNDPSNPRRRQAAAADREAIRTKYGISG